MPVTLQAAHVMEIVGVSLQRADMLLSAARPMVENYGATRADNNLLNEATLRVCGWLAAQPFASVRAEDTGGISTNYDTRQQSALRSSGAMAMLSPFRTRRAGAI